MDGQGGETAADQDIGQFLALQLGVAEHEGRFRAVMGKNAHHRLTALFVVHLIKNLFDGALVMGLVHTHINRLMLNQGTHGSNGIRIGGGKQQGLPLHRSRGDQR